MVSIRTKDTNKNTENAKKPDDLFIFPSLLCRYCANGVNARRAENHKTLIEPEYARVMPRASTPQCVENELSAAHRDKPGDDDKE